MTTKPLLRLLCANCRAEIIMSYQILVTPDGRGNMMVMSGSYGVHCCECGCVHTAGDLLKIAPPYGVERVKDVDLR